MLFPAGAWTTFTVPIRLPDIGTVDHLVYSLGMRKSENIKIQKRVSSMIAFTGLIVVVSNILRNLYFREKEFLDIVVHDPSISFVFAFSLLIFLTRKLESRVIQYVHIALFLANAALALMSEYDAFHGMGFILLAIALSYRYGLLEKHSRIKLIFIALFTLFFLEFSIYRSGDDQVGSSFNIIVYFIFFLTIVYLIYMDELNRMLHIERLFKEKVLSMEEEKVRLLEDMEGRKAELILMDARMKELEKLIEESKKPLDLKKFRITPREEDVIGEFCRNPHLTTKEIAYNLNMSLGTIKQHFNSIFKKLKVRNRSELLNKYKWNYSR
jgi:DNA-binding CsgD family transcriptional regulator